MDNITPAVENEVSSNNSIYGDVPSVIDFYQFGLEGNPRKIEMRFRDVCGILYLRLIMRCSNKEVLQEEFPANSELIESVLSAFNGDIEKLKKFEYDFETIIKSEGEEDIVIEMFKAFLDSPYRRDGMMKTLPDGSKSQSFHIHGNCFVCFFFPTDWADKAVNAYYELKNNKDKQNNDTQD